jgi:NhaA family Na+:H+ antiporter
MALEKIREFLKLESAAGIILMFAAAFAILLANSPLAWLYEAFNEMPVEVRVGPLNLAKPMLLWINDGLMAVFFLMVGLEMKREMLDGELSNREQIVMPAVAALGGFILPAAIYSAVNWNDSSAINGWAIASATDIAFALGVLALLGKNVPLALKIFLTTVAIFDDLGAIVTIAIFYTQDLSVVSLGLAGVFTIGLIIINRLGVTSKAAYILLGIALWITVLKSGVHATLAGIVVAFAIPFRDPGQADRSPVTETEHALHPWVAYAILPVFAFANAGVNLTGTSVQTLLEPVPMGIALGLVVGKQVGVFGSCWVLIKLGLAKLPKGTDWTMIYGAALLSGIGFTMSLFIGTLAFEHGNYDFATEVRIGVLAGSLASALLGYLLLRWRLARPVGTAAN